MAQPNDSSCLLSGEACAEAIDRVRVTTSGGGDVAVESDKLGDDEYSASAGEGGRKRKRKRKMENAKAVYLTEVKFDA
jgi:hypothetical protein